MLHSRRIIETVCEGLENRKIPLVVDPVMIATSGDPLLKEEAVSVYEERLFKRATVVTPNLDEAGALLGRAISSVDEMRVAGRELVEKFGVPFLLKGGHLRGDTALDLLFASGKIFEFAAPYVHGVSTHGTGCTYSAAITAGLAKGLPLAIAVAEAKQFVTRAIANHFRWKNAGGTTDALNHFQS
jgi:hydroxymethylpyrimidine/phosphomethylpyrimidine kinase